MSHEEHVQIIDGRQVNEGFSLSKPLSLLYHVLLNTGSQTLSWALYDVTPPPQTCSFPNFLHIRMQLLK